MEPWLFVDESTDISRPKHSLLLMNRSGSPYREKLLFNVFMFNDGPLAGHLVPGVPVHVNTSDAIGQSVLSIRRIPDS